MKYVNEYGLVNRTGLDSVATSYVGAVELPFHDLYMRIDFDENGLYAGSMERAQENIPAGSIIDSAVLFVTEGAATPATVLDIGTKKVVAGALVVEDSDGLLDGETTSEGKHEATPGAQIGTKTNVTLYPYVDNVGSATDAALAGLKAVVKIRYYII